MRISDSVWYSTRKNDYNSEIGTYSFPQEIKTRANYLTVSSNGNGYLEILKYGEKASKYYTIVANANYFKDTFNHGDLFWIGIEPDMDIESEYGNGASANAVVKSVAMGNLYINLELEENDNRIK